MSMNLIFETEHGRVVDFPFQTPTELTYTVLRAKTNDERLSILQEYVEGHFKPEDREGVMEEIKALMYAPDLELSLI